MKIRTRLTLLFTAITATLLLTYAGVIYFSAHQTREKEFAALLRKEAITKANLFFNAKIDAQTLQQIYRNNRNTLNEVEVAIYDTAGQLLYHDAVDIDIVKETPKMLTQILRMGELHFQADKWQAIGMRFHHQGNAYLITAAALDEYGFNKLRKLLQNIFVAFLVAVVIIYLSGRYLALKAFEPVQQITAKARQITATNLDLRLPITNKKDELSELAATFNEMLERLEHSFEAQKQFVYHISHELRTPLTALTSELELAAQKQPSPEQYLTVINNALHDTKRLVTLTNGLLDLARAHYDQAAIKMKKVELDQLLLDAAEQLQQAHPHYQIILNLADNYHTEEAAFEMEGNEYLLKTAFINLIDNACKFSANHTCYIDVLKDEYFTLLFKDEGIGIAAEELYNIFTPFYRGQNSHVAQGYGIGLSLTKKIVQLHAGTIEVQSQPGQGTTFTVRFPCSRNI